MNDRRGTSPHSLAARGSRRVGLIGWRGMVGQVLIERMTQAEDFDLEGVEYFLFSTSQGGRASPISQISAAVFDARNLDRLRTMDYLVSCQGSEYTQEIHPRLRRSGWEGCWIDAASHLRTDPDSTLVLDVVNRDLILRRWREGCLDFIGANCTVSLMMIAIAPLLKLKWIDWIFASTYQSASGAGAAGVEELMRQSRRYNSSPLDRDDARTTTVSRAQTMRDRLLDNHSRESAFSAPLTMNVIPWIDSHVVETGQSREEWKAEVECNTILGNGDYRVSIEGVCVRVPVLRCHSQSLLVQLNRSLTDDEVKSTLSDNPWVDWVDNTPEATAAELHPLAVHNSLKIKIGRVRRALAGADNANRLQIFTVGDQLLWGAAEPLRRVLRLLLTQS